LAQSTKGMTTQVAAVGQSFASVASLAKGAFAVAGVSTAIQTLKGLAAGAIELGDALQKAHDQTGIAVETLSGLNTIAVETDVSLAELARTVRILGTNLTEALRDPKGDVAKTFKAAGISEKELLAVRGDNAKLLELYARGLNSVTDDTNKLSIAQKLSGRSSLEMMQFLQQLGTQGLDNTIAKARKAGLIIGPEFAQQADAFNDAISTMGLTLKVLMVERIGPLISLILDLAGAFGLIERTAAKMRLETVNLQIKALNDSIKAAKDSAEAQGKPVERTWLGKFMFGTEPAAPVPAPKLTEWEQTKKDLEKEKGAIELEINKPLIPPRPPVSGTLPTKDSEDRANKLTEALKRLDEQQRLIALSSAVMGRAYDEPRAQLSQFTSELQFLAEFHPQQTTEELAALQQRFRELVKGEELSQLNNQLRITAQTQGLFHDDMAAGEATIAAYGTAIDGLVTRLGATAQAEIAALKARKDAAEGEQARLQQAQQIGEAYKTFAMGLQHLTNEQAAFADEGAKATKTLELYQTLFQALITLGPAAAEGLGEVVDQINRQKLPDIEQILAPSQRGAELFKDLPLKDFDPLADQVQRLKAALDRVRDDPTIDKHSEQVVNLTAKYQELSTVMRLGDIGGEVFGGFMQGFDQLVTGVIQGTQSMDDAFNKLAESLILGFTRRLLQEMFRPLEDAMIKLIRQLAQVGFQGLFGSGGETGGGSLTSGGGRSLGLMAPEDLTFQRLQHGGLFSKPTLAMVAEAGSPEVVLPQAKLHAWMQGMMAGIEPGGAAVTVNVINNARNTQVTQQERQGPQGQRSLDILIDEAVAQQLSRSGSASSRALKNVYGSGPMLTGR
jgi:hypothetical protein